MIKLTKLCAFLLVLISFDLLAGDNFYFKYLNKKIADYSNKIVLCDSKKVTPKLSQKEYDVLKKIVTEKPLILAHLSSRAYNKCLQPERNELAELLLSYNHLDLPSHTKNLAKSTEKLAFTRDFDILKSYESLSNKERELLDSIQALQHPFNELDIFESVMGM